MTYDEFQTALKEADERMKRTNGHQFVHILKTRCDHCGASPKRKTRCGGWFQTFVNQLGVVFQERGVITKAVRPTPAIADRPKTCANPASGEIYEH